MPTLTGTAILKVPPGTQSGQILRLRGQGIRTPEGKQGDLLFKVQITVPRRLTPKQEKLLRELAALEAEQKQLQAQLQELQNVRIVIPEIDPSRRETVASLQAELDALQQELAQMERELEQRLQAAETTVSVLPAGSGVHLKPHFVECAKGAIVLHTQNPPKLIRAAEMVTDADFLNVLNTVAAGPEDMLVFLIRPDGLPVYRAAKTLCDELGIRSGRLPVPGDGRIDLTRFSRSRTVP